MSFITQLGDTPNWLPQKSKEKKVRFDQKYKYIFFILHLKDDFIFFKLLNIEQRELCC